MTTYCKRITPEEADLLWTLGVVYATIDYTPATAPEVVPIGSVFPYAPHPKDVAISFCVSPTECFKRWGDTVFYAAIEQE